jgi:glycerate kinase
VPPRPAPELSRERASRRSTHASEHGPRRSTHASDPPPLLVAPDAFKGTLDAPRVAAAIGRGVRRAGLLEPDLCPVADGGEGTLDVLLAALGGTRLAVEVSDPLGRPVLAHFGLLEADGAGGKGPTAVVEVADASGLGRVAEHERDPLAASTEGTGQLIAAAIEAGARHVLVGAGGSATTDGGAGALAALTRAGGLREASLTVLCDVRTPFELAAERFAAQKGARDPETVRRLSRRLRRQARSLPRDPRGIPMTGAAGGLAGGLWAALGARLEAGAPFVLRALDFDRRLRRSRAVVVGEGRLDRGTLEGKAPGEIAVRARQGGVPAHAIVGVNALDAFDARLLDLGLILEAGDEAQLERAGRELSQRL